MKKPLSATGANTALALTLAYSLPAWAGRPLATEDASVMSRCKCEIESSAARLTEANSLVTTGRRAPFSCGIGLKGVL